MARKKKTIKDRGIYKTKIANALFKSDNIKEVILGDTSNMKKSEILSGLKSHINSHLFIDETIKDTSTFIFYDVIIPDFHTQTKDMNIIMYVICHRDILETYSKDGYYGNRTDILAEMIEETLLDESIIKEFGIGDLSFDSMDIYNANSFYGCILRIGVPTFR